MNRKLLFVLFAVLMMAVMTVSVSADQDAYDRFCNMDQYGCWNTNDEGGKDYIMFWSEAAREYFMGPGSNATVTDYCADCNGKLGMGSGAPEVTKKSLRDILIEMISDIYNEIGWGEYIEIDAKYMEEDISAGYATLDDIQDWLDNLKN